LGRKFSLINFVIKNFLINYLNLPFDPTDLIAKNTQKKHGPFDPTVASAGISRLKDLDLIYFSFIITTYEPNIVWGGKGYADGNLVEGYFAFNNCTLYAP